MADLKISPEKAILLLNGRIDSINTMKENLQSMGYYDIIRWCSETWSVIDEIYRAEDRHPEEIRITGTPACSCSSPETTQMLLATYHSRLLEYIDEIRRGMKKPEQ
jgi:hypothetical protein